MHLHHIQAICPHCKAKLGKKGVKKHPGRCPVLSKNSEQPASADTTARKRKKNNSPLKMTYASRRIAAKRPGHLCVCPQCKTYVRADGYDLHLKHCNASDVRNSNLPEPQDLSSTAQKESEKPIKNNSSTPDAPPKRLTLIQCDYCKGHFGAKRIADHARSCREEYVRGRRKKSSSAQRTTSFSQAQPTTSSGVSVKVSNPKNYVLKKVNNNAKKKRKKSSFGRVAKNPAPPSLDGSKYIGYHRRDRGRYGSMPSYDNYGEDAFS